MRTPILETERMILRPLTVADAKYIYLNWTSDPEVARYMIWELHEKVEDTVEWLNEEEKWLDGDESYLWGLVLKSAGPLFGSAGIHYNKEISQYELGYNIMKKYWCQGFTTEACRAILSFGKNQLKIQEFFCRHAKENIASEKVIKKLGFVYQKDDSYTSIQGRKHFECKDYVLYV